MIRVMDILRFAPAATAVVIAAVGIVVIAPVVSLVAVPIFALKALPHWIEHRSLYKRTLTNRSRETFGRVRGQDYTRWDGKAVTQIKTNPTWQERMHELIDAYVHGRNDDSFQRNFNTQVTDCPFQTQEDVNWLQREYTRREKKDLLDSDLKMLRAFSKALIPIIGVIWVLLSETGMGGASEMGCRVCMMGGDSEATHWGWREAINFHKKNLLIKLGTPNPSV